MKRLIISGLVVTLGLMPGGAQAQEIQWQAASPKNAVEFNVRPALQSGESPTTVRPISLTKPIVAATSSDMSSFRVLAPTVARGVSQGEKALPGVPRLEIEVPEQIIPRPMPKNGTFTPPPPKAMPSPVYGPLGITQDNGGILGGGDCCDGDSCRPRRLARFGPGGFGDDCGPERGRFWVGAQYLMWWQRSQSVPPLASSSAAGVPSNEAGVLFNGKTDILFDNVPNPGRPGARFTLGKWLPHFGNLGIETNFFFLGNQSGRSTFGGNNGNPQVGKPFFDVQSGTQDREAVDIPGLANGTLTIDTYSQLWGIETNLRRRWRSSPNHWCDVLVGYRHLNLSEGIDVLEDISTQAGRIIERDSFRTRNQFNGMQLGFEGECRIWNCLFFGWSTKIALGNVHQVINIDGSTQFSAAPAVTVPGGLYALNGTNIGTHSANRIAILPEVNLKLGIDITDNLRFFVGYDFLYLSSVVRPGEQIDPRVNQSFRPTNTITQTAGTGDRVPAVLFRTSDYWAQGLNFGLWYRY
ncbi:MAG: hypothetical protein EXS16_14375 [Gemmataceae bacterium]|nr:hypothetical protein [Gemmataceae bacterium]